MLKINIKYKRILAVILLFCLLNMDFYNFLLGKINIMDGIRMVTAIAIGWYFLFIRKGKVSLVTLFIIIMQMPLMVSTFLNKGNLWGWLVETGSFLAIALWFELFYKNMGELLEALMLFLEMLCYANFITVQIFPDGLYSSYTDATLWSSSLNWLLGNRNIFIVYLLPACMIAFLYRQNGGTRCREYGIYIVSWLSVALPPVSSSTSTVGITVLLIFFILLKRGVKFDVYLLASINIITFFAIVVFRLQDVLFSWLIENILKKTLTFTGRTLLWDAVIEAVKRRPLFGYGVQDGLYSARLLGFSYAGHAHNLILHYLYQGGIIYLTAYLILLIIIYNRLHKYQNSSSIQAISVTLFVFQIMALMEPYKYAFTLVLYLFAYHAAYVSKTDRLQQAGDYLNN